MLSLPDISIIITTQKGRDTLNFSLRSALEATANLNAELIIVKFRDEPLPFLPPKKVKVVNAAKKTSPEKRNLGLSISKSKFVHFLDDDDFVSKNFYINMLRLLKNNKDSVGIACSVLVVDKNNRPIKKIIKKKCLCYYNDILLRNKIGTTSSVILKKSFLKQEKFKIGLNARQDFDLWLRLLSKNPKKHFQIIPDILIRYTKSSTKSINLTTTFKEHFISALKVVFSEKRALKDYIFLSIGVLRYSTSKIFR